MSAQGMVTTARGEKLNLDQLIMDRKKPIGFKETKSEIKAKVKTRKPINVRGFVPARGDAPAPIVPDAPEVVAKEIPMPRRSFAQGEASRLADLTGIRMDKAKHLKERTSDPLAAAAAEADAIMKDLTQANPRAVAATERRKKSRSAEWTGDSEVVEVEE